MLQKSAGYLIFFILFAAMSPAITINGQDKDCLSLRDAVRLAKSGKQEEAIAEIKKIIEQKPDNMDAYLSLGIVYFKSKQYDNALNEFAGSTEVRKDNPMPYYFMGLIYEKKAKAEGVSDEKAREFKKNALTNWHTYLEVSKNTTMKPSQSHKNIYIRKKASIKRAKKHISVLEQELENEKN